MPIPLLGSADPVGRDALAAVAKKATRNFLRATGVEIRGNTTYWLVVAVVVRMERKTTGVLLTLETADGIRILATTSDPRRLSVGVARLVLLATHPAPSPSGDRQRDHVHYAASWEVDGNPATSLATRIRRQRMPHPRGRIPALPHSSVIDHEQFAWKKWGGLLNLPVATVLESFGSP
jgi:hypothetical protein